MPVELTVTDDGSTDKTVDFILGFADQLEFPVQVVRNDVRLGYGRNFLKAAPVTALALACYSCIKSVSKITDAFKSWLPCGST